MYSSSERLERLVQLARQFLPSSLGVLVAAGAQRPGRAQYDDQANQGNALVFISYSPLTLV